VYHLFGVLLAVELGRVHHVGEGGLCLRPLSGLQTTVRVDPELIWSQVLKHLSDAVLDLLLAWNTRGVDVVDTRTDVTGVGLVDEDLEQLSIRFAVLNAENISVKSGNSMEEVLELRVAEMGVDLGAVGNTGGGQTERLDSPVKIFITLLACTKRQTLTQSRLVDLDDVDTSRLEVEDFVTQGKSKLLSLHGLVDVVTRERPAEASDGAREHALHRLLRDGSSILGLLDGHWTRAGDITNDDRRTHATGSIALDPGVGGEDEASKLLTEVLDHIIALRLTVDEDIQVKLLLDLDDLLDLLLDELLVLLSSNLALGELVALNTDLLGLGERSNSGGWEQRKVKSLLLLSDTDRERRLAVVHVFRDSRLPLPDLGVVRDLGRGTGLDRLGVGLELLTDGGRALSNSLGDHDHFGTLLDSKAEPIPDLGVKVLLALEGVRNVQQGARGGNNDSVLAEFLDSKLDLLNGGLEVRLPDVTAVNDTSGEGLVGTESANDGLKLLWVANKVNVDGVQVLERGQDVDVVNDVTEVGGKGDTRRLVTKSTQLLVGRLESSLRLGREVEDENGLIDLDILSAGLLELGKELHVQRKELLKMVDRRNRLSTVGLGEGQEGDRSKDDRTGDDTGLLGLKELNDRLGLSGQLELLVVLKSRLDVVVVRVEPFHHFLDQFVSQKSGMLDDGSSTYQAGNVDGGKAILGWSLQTTTHGEVLVKRVEAILGVSLRDDLIGGIRLNHGINGQLGLPTPKSWMWSRTWS